MQNLERKKTLVWVFDIALMADVISQCRTMPFKQKYDIVKLGEYCKALIEHSVGEELMPLLEAENQEQAEIQQKFEKEIADFLADHPDFKEASYRETQKHKLVKMAKDSEVLKECQKKREDLMKKSCDEDIPAVSIPIMQYDEKLTEEKKTATFMGGYLTMDGMEALMGLISKGAVVLDEPKEEKPE